MGRAARWLMSLFGDGRKKEKEQKEKVGFHYGDLKERKRWSFGNSCLDVGRSSVPASEDAWPRGCYNEAEAEQKKQALAVAAVTAAAADAAVAAANAAIAVVRLSSHERRRITYGGRQMWAAVKIQTVFRGFLAKKALRALKGLVKLQAHVRGYLVRKEAAATLHSMQVLIRAQTTFRAQKSHSLLKKSQNFQREAYHPGKSIERLEDPGDEQTASIYSSRRLSASHEISGNGSPKIVEIDTCRHKSRTKRASASVSDHWEDPPLSSPLPSHIPARLSIPSCRNFQDSDWGLAREDWRVSSTAHTTPRFVVDSWPLTPSESAESLSRRYCSPSYMANTQSFRAKLRSLSAPKQRLEQGFKKRLSLSDLVGSRASLSGVKMQSSCSQVQETLGIENGVMGRLERSMEFVREAEREYLRRW